MPNYEEKGQEFNLKDGKTYIRKRFYSGAKLSELSYKNLKEAIRLYVEKGIPEANICCVCIISAPQGIEAVFNEFPDIKLIVASVDSHLNERGYIVPGMGDAGDRIFNT